MASAAVRPATLSAAFLVLALFVPGLVFADGEATEPGTTEPGTTEPGAAQAAKKPALNGTIGGFGQIGLHVGEALTSSGEGGRWFDFGGGAEIGLASATGRLGGRIRASYYGVIDIEGEIRHNGVFSAGMSIQLLKDIQRPFGVYALVDVGVSPLVTELRVFVFADVGVGVRYRPVERVELFAEATAFLRFEKTVAAGPLVFLGARFRL